MDFYGYCLTDKSTKKTTYTVTAGGYHRSAMLLQLNWQSSDLVHLVGPTSPSPTPSLTPNPTPLSTLSSSAVLVTSSKSISSLPKKATIGLAVAAGLVGITLLVLIPYLLLRWRHKRQRKPLRGSRGRWDKAELPQDHARLPGEMGNDGERFELPTDWGAEMPAQEDFAELHGSRAMYELETQG